MYCNQLTYFSIFILVFGALQAVNESELKSILQKNRSPRQLVKHTLLRIQKAKPCVKQLYRVSTKSGYIGILEFYLFMLFLNFAKRIKLYIENNANYTKNLFLNIK